MPIPKTMPKKHYHLIEHVKKPDLDNLIKLVKDCCNGIVWHDDSQVVKEECQKFYSWDSNPQTLIEVKW
jgi:Holliday junction resolvase RusA-like endonuclease